MNTFYNKLAYKRNEAIGKTNWLGNLHWFFEETDNLMEYVFSTIPSIKSDGQESASECGSFDMKRILFSASVKISKTPKEYVYLADTMKINANDFNASIHMPFNDYGAVIEIQGLDKGYLSIKTSDKSGRINSNMKSPKVDIFDNTIHVEDQNYFIVFKHNGIASEIDGELQISCNDGALKLTAGFYNEKLKAVEIADVLFEQTTAKLLDSIKFWDEYLESCPIGKLDEDYTYYNEFLGRQELYKRQDFETRQLWHYWSMLINVSKIDFNQYKTYMAPDKTRWKGVWSNDGPESLCALSLTNQTALARECIVSYIKASINGDGIHSWYVHSDGTGCYGTENDSGIYSHGVPNIVHTVGFYIKNTNDSSILKEPAGDNMSVWEKLKKYILVVHSYRDINNDNLIEWVNLWETGWDDKLGQFFHDASLEEWIDAVINLSKSDLAEFYNKNSRPTTSIVEQVYMLWALEAMAYMSKITADNKLLEYCEEMHTKMVEAVREKCWNEKEGFYFDIDVKKNKQSSSKNADAFYFMFFEKDAKRLDRIFSHMENTKEFNLCYMPMASFDCTDFNENGYWSGGHWPREMSYVSFGLSKSGYKDKAKELLIRAIMSCEGNIIAEVINPVSGVKSTEVTKMAYNVLNVVAWKYMTNEIDW